jgi:bifunctional non-homologous end joining protein LigD
VLPYSVRARDGAPVAVPIAWSELKDISDAHPFSLGDCRKLIDRSRSGSLAGWGCAEQALPDL